MFYVDRFLYLYQIFLQRACYFSYKLCEGAKERRKTGVCCAGQVAATGAQVHGHPAPTGNVLRISGRVLLYISSVKSFARIFKLSIIISVLRMQ